MKIISLKAENVKRLRAVEIKPTTDVVKITGKNGQGKTSVLDAIWWAVAGASHIQSVPIRKGEKEARIRLDMGEIVVTRKFQQGEKGQTTSITVENADGAHFPRPQAMLDKLLDQLCFDPLAFARMDAREQFEQLKRFVPSVDFAQMDELNQKDYTRRTDVNRLAKDARSAAKLIVVPDETPSALIDVDELVSELSRAGDANADIERRRANRERATAEITRLRGIHANHEERFGSFAKERQARCDTEVADLLAQMEALKMRIETAQQRAMEEINARSAQIAVEAINALDEANAIQAKLDAAGELPALQDLEALQARIRAANGINEAVKRAQQRAQHIKVAEKYEAESATITARMEDRERTKQEAIANAEMPVAGLGFGDGEITYNGIPFDQASDAERLRVSVAIAIAQNPKLRVLRIRDGSLLDDGGMKLLEGMASEHDFQIWIEIVGGDGKIGFVIEDGSVANEPQEPAT